jgi:hypothetical protein
VICGHTWNTSGGSDAALFHQRKNFTNFHESIRPFLTYRDEGRRELLFDPILSTKCVRCSPGNTAGHGPDIFTGRSCNLRPVEASFSIASYQTNHPAPLRHTWYWRLLRPHLRKKYVGEEMNNLFRGAIAVAAAYKLGGGLFSMILIFLITSRFSITFLKQIRFHGVHSSRRHFGTYERTFTGWHTQFADTWSRSDL